MQWDLDPLNVGTGLPLEGVRVLDLSRVLAGPLAGMVVGDLGADVIKVESPDGDPVRGLAPPRFGPDATYFLAVNRHRRNVVLDLRQSNDRELLDQLVAQADAVIENFLPSQRRSLGIDAIREAHPDVVWVSVTPASSDGPLADRPAFDLLAQARSGLMDVTGAADGGPTKVGAPLADVVTGLYAAVGLLTGLFARLQGRPGRHFEAPLLESTMTALVNQAQGYLATGVPPRRLGNDHPSIAPYGPVPTADGAVMLAIGTDAQFDALVDLVNDEALSNPSWRTNDGRVADRHGLAQALAGCFTRAATRTWEERLRDSSVPFAPILSVPEAFLQEHIAAGDFVTTVPHPAGAFRMMRSPLRIDGVRPPIRRGPQRQGGDQGLLD
jgi:crotonobetainyl-CoA:carnitine CoA-transferase CaiB-like acyl-CoA transferase